MVNQRFRSILHIFSALAILFSAVSCQGALSMREATALKPVTVGMDATAVNSLILIADHQKYFEAQGLSVTIKTYSSGRDAISGMLNQEVDIATASEFAVVSRILVGNKLLIWASIDKFTNNYLIARRDRGIDSPDDLVGKTFGLPDDTSAEFYLGRYLELQRIRLEQVTILDVPPDQVLEAIVSGEIDAAVIWQPHAKTIQDRLGDNALSLPIHSGQSAYACLVSTEEFTKSDPRLVEAFLKALAQAEAFYTSKPEQAVNIIQSRLEYDGEYMAVTMREHRLQLILEQSLVLTMEDEARWMINNRLTTATQTPNFLDYLYLEGMLAVKPAAVNIIH